MFAFLTQFDAKNAQKSSILIFFRQIDVEISEAVWYGADVRFDGSPEKNGICEKKEILGNIYRDHKNIFVPREIIIIFLLPRRWHKGSNGHKEQYCMRQTLANCLKNNMVF